MGKPGRRVFWIALLAVPPAVYLAFLAAQAINVPINDDYFAVYDFLLRWQDLPPGGRTPPVLFEQFYSHRIPLTRLLVLGSSSLLGSCDLRPILAVAWAAWVLLFASLCRHHYAARRDHLALLPLSLLLMQPQGSSNFLVAAGSPGHAGCILLAFWSLRFAGLDSGRATGTGVLCALGATLCSINGLLVFPVAVAYLGWGRRWRSAGIWTLFGGVVWGGYLAGYSVAMQPFAAQGFSAGQFLLNAGTMLGGLAALGTLGTASALGVGALLTVAALWFFQDEIRNRRLDTASLLLIFLFLSTALTAWGRMGWDHSYMLQDRYRPYPLLIVALLYLKVLDLVPPPGARLFAGAVAILAALFCFLSYAQNFALVTFGRSWAETTAMNLELGQSTPMTSAPEQAGRARQVLEESVRRGNLRPPRLLHADGVAALNGLRQFEPSTLLGPVAARMEESVAGYLIEPPPAEAREVERPDFGVIVLDGKPVAIPIVNHRARFAEIPRRLSFLGPQYEFVVPRDIHRGGDGVLFAIKRDPGGLLAVLWKSPVHFPPAAPGGP